MMEKKLKKGEVKKMKSKLASLFFVFAFLISSLAPQALVFAASADKIGTVDLARVFDEYQKTKDFDKTLEGKGAQKQADRDRMVNEVKKLRDEAELLSAKAKEDRQSLIDEKIRLLQEFDRTTRDSLRKERDNMVRDILKEIEGVMQNFGKAQGYSFIFNDRVLVYKGEAADVTNQIIKALNESYSKKK